MRFIINRMYEEKGLPPDPEPDTLGDGAEEKALRTLMDKPHLIDFPAALKLAMKLDPPKDYPISYGGVAYSPRRSGSGGGRRTSPRR